MTARPCSAAEQHKQRVGTRRTVFLDGWARSSGNQLMRGCARAATAGHRPRSCGWSRRALRARRALPRLRIGTTFTPTCSAFCAPAGAHGNSEPEGCKGRLRRTAQSNLQRSRPRRNSDRWRRHGPGGVVKIEFGTWARLRITGPVDMATHWRRLRPGIANIVDLIEYDDGHLIGKLDGDKTFRYHRPSWRRAVAQTRSESAIR